MSLPPVSLIIPTCNRPDMLHDTVLSILDGNEVPDEIIIVDQSKTVHPVLSAYQPDRACNIHYVQSVVRGATRAINSGIDLARNDIIVIINDDIFVEKTWLCSLIQVLLDAGPRGAVAGRILPTASVAPGGFVPTLKEDTEAATYRGRIHEDVFLCVNIALFRSAFQEVGYFDVQLGPGTSYHSAEDNDLGFRLLEAGYQIRYVPEAIVYHRAWRAARDFLPLRWKYGYGQGAFYAKYFSLKDRFMLGRMWEDVARHAGRVLRYGLKRSRMQNFADIIYTAGLISGAGTWLLTPQKMQ
jgi:GT2 family glycosyltransferase